MINLKNVLNFFIIAFSLSISSQELPPIQNFPPSVYHSESQNWAISQTKEKIIYAANNQGLLEFNGAEWTVYPSPNGSIVRSVHVNGDKVFTGCYMEFGYWERDVFGTLQYTSLSSLIKKNLVQDEEIWNILAVGEWIAFQSHSRIYIYDSKNNLVNTITTDAFLPKIFKVGQSVYFQKIGQGIFKIENGRDTLLFDGGVTKNDEIINIFDVDGSMLMLTKHNGFYRFSDGFFEKWSTEADALLSDISLYSGIKLKNGNFALGTISHGLLLLDEKGKPKFHIDQANGLQNNTILALFEDKDQNIWMGLDVGISYINLNAPLLVYHDSNGQIGSVYESAVKDGKLYLGTNQGLYYKELDSSGDFKFIEGTHGQVWFLGNIGQTLFCGHHTGTYVVEGDRVRQISDIQGAWKIGMVPGSKGFLLQGNYNGLYLLEQIEGEWKVKNKIQGFDHSARYFEILENNIFVNHEYKGVFKLNVNPDFSRVNHIEIDTIIKGSNSGMTMFMGDLLYTYQKGVLKYDLNQNAFIRDSTLSQLYTEDEYVSGKLVVDGKSNGLWMFTDTNVNHITGGELSNSPEIRRIPFSEDMRDGIIGYESVTAMNQNDAYLFGARSGYFIVDINEFQRNDFQVHISSIRKAGKNKNQTQKSLVDLSVGGSFEHDDNSLEIAYYVSIYDKYLKPKYQYRLLDIYDDWSEWSEESSVLFENLPSGDYTFNVRAKTGGQISENVASYSFKIERPWYLSNLFLGLYIAMGIIGSILIHNAYKRHYSKRQRKLIEENQREMALAKAQNEKEIIKIKNEQLQEEFKSKSNELAASTMSIIKKNELLSKVKEQLLASVEDKNSVKPIIHVIDKNLNQNDDWELFKEAFNNADRKFLKKLKKEHPNLSPNDIRLCAYLRLNLSSKEIAPMFNISPRSVEIKRYRLRKKMNLSHDDNLTNYILSL